MGRDSMFPLVKDCELSFKPHWFLLIDLISDAISEQSFYIIINNMLVSRSLGEELQSYSCFKGFNEQINKPASTVCTEYKTRTK